MATIVIITMVAFALAMLLMAVGVIFRRPCLRGSCGGPEVLGAGGEPLSCGACPRRKEKPASDDAGSEGSLPILS